MNVKLDLSHLTIDLTEIDLVELTILHDALANYVETLFPAVAEALAAGASMDDAVDGLDENDAFRIRTIVERLYDKIERPLTILEEEADLQAEEDEDGIRVRIVLASEEEAGLIHGAAVSLGDQVGRALEASDLPYPDAERLVREFASWFDPDDIPEYPYYIEMEVADARIIAQLAERVQAHAPTERMAQLIKVMSAAAAVETDED